MSESPIPSMEDIRSASDLPVFEVTGDLEWMEGPVLVGNNDFESLAEFARAVGAKVVLVQYDYPDFDDYYVDPDDFPLHSLFGEEREDEIVDMIEDRNDDFEDFLDKEYDNEPFACSVYVMYEGTPYGFYVEDDALIEAFGETGEEFIVRLAIEDEEDYGGPRYDDEDEEDGAFGGEGDRPQSRRSLRSMESGEGVEPP